MLLLGVPILLFVLACFVFVPVRGVVVVDVGARIGVDRVDVGVRPFNCERSDEVRVGVGVNTTLEAGVEGDSRLDRRGVPVVLLITIVSPSVV